MDGSEGCNKASQNTVLSLILILGVFGNSLLITGILRFRHRGWKPDKILILNFACVDLLACLVSLPLHLTILNTSPAVDAICVSKFHLMFSCFANNIMTLAVIGIDRYDAVCVFPRKITCRRTIYMLVFVWCFGCLGTLAGGAGYTNAVINGERVCITAGMSISEDQRVFRGAMVGVVCTWIIPSLAILVNRFTGIMRFLRRHNEEVRTSIVAARAAREIKLYKVCVVLVSTYLSLWILFAVMVVVRNRMHSTAVHCTYEWAYNMAYASYSVVPLEYMLLDRRIGQQAFRRIRPRPSITTSLGVNDSNNISNNFVVQDLN